MTRRPCAAATWRRPCYGRAPELGKSPPADDGGRSRAARGVDRRVRHRDADQVDEREDEPDRDPCERYRSLRIRGGEDREDEDEREDDLEHERAARVEPTRRVRAIAIRREAGGDGISARVARRHEVEEPRGHDRSEHLGSDVAAELPPRQPSW